MGREILLRIDARAECGEAPQSLTRSDPTEPHLRANELVLAWLLEARRGCRVDQAVLCTGGRRSLTKANTHRTGGRLF